MPLEHSSTIGALATAKAQAQSKFSAVGKDKKANVGMKSGGAYSYTYADLAACLESVIPALSEVGIALFQPTSVSGDAVTATTLLVHGESGEWISDSYTVIALDPRDPRSVGSAVTYARRYGLCAMLAIAPADEDDDAESARGGAHAMAQPASVATGVQTPQQSAACPNCGQLGSLRESNYTPGDWYCSRRAGGCNKTFKGWPGDAKLPKETKLDKLVQAYEDEPPPRVEPDEGPHLTVVEPPSGNETTLALKRSVVMAQRTKLGMADEEFRQFCEATIQKSFTAASEGELDRLLQALGQRPVQARPRTRR